MLDIDLAVGSGPVIYFVWQADEDWTTEYVSSNVASLGYYPSDFIEGRVGFADLIHPEDRERVANETFQHERVSRTEYRLSHRMVTSTGETRWMDVWTIARRDESGVIVRHIGFAVDVTEHKQIEDGLRQSEEKFRAIVEQSRDGIAVWTPDGRVDLYNQAMERVSGYTQEEVNRDGWYNLVFPDPEVRGQAIRASMRAMLGKHSYFEQPIVRKNGETAWLSFSFTPVEVAGRQYNLSIITDITQRRSQEQQLAYLSSHDALTGLATRRSIEEGLQRMTGRVERGSLAALIWLDLDNLKVVNDSLGHAAGDRALTTVAGILREHVKPGDTIARVGGDEFAVLLEDVSVEAAVALAEELRRSVDECQFEHDGQAVNLGLSCGVATLEAGSSPTQTLSQANVALGRAKESGRNRVVLFSPDAFDLETAAQANSLAVQLKEALRLDRFLVHYQPVVRLSSGRIEHYEALIRLRDDRGNLVPPMSFIFAAERIGIMPQLTRWLVREVVRKLHEIRGISVFVNLSAQCLADSTLPDYIIDQLYKADVPPDRLGFEVTETVMVQDLGLAERWIQRLRALGCLFALDDFGSGYSSLGYLRNLPFDLLKIDGSLVRTIAQDQTQRVFVQVIYELGTAIGKEVVAEYVESEAIAEILKEIGVALGQGYYLGRPGPDLPAG